MRRVGILTISDRGARGEYEDKSGPIAAEMITARAGWPVERRAIIPDEFELIKRTLIGWCEEGFDLILTSGGTGFAPRDVTPEATRAVLDYEVPGIADAIRMYGWPRVPGSVLSRGVAGVAGRTLIVNLPGSTGGVRDGLDVLGNVVEHALDQLRGGDH